jgi:hypothetical protein
MLIPHAREIAMRRAILVAVALAALALVGCDGKSTKQDLAACKLKALEHYPTKLQSKEYEDEQVYYVQICMEAAGYQLKLEPQCSDAASRWMADSCYLRDGKQ